MHPIPCAGELVLVAGSSCFKQDQHGWGPMAPPFADHWSNAHGHTRRSLVKKIGPHNPIHLLHPFLHPPQMTDTTWHCSAITLLPHQHHVAELCSHCCQSLWSRRHSPSSSLPQRPRVLRHHCHDAVTPLPQHTPTARLHPRAKSESAGVTASRHDRAISLHYDQEGEGFSAAHATWPNGMEKAIFPEIPKPFTSLLH